MKRTLLLLISLITIPQMFSATVYEAAGGFSFTAPDAWERIYNKRKSIQPSVTFDTMFSRQPKRIMIPSGWEDLDESSALTATENLVRLTFKYELTKKESSNFRSKDGVPVTFTRYVTNIPDTPTIVIYTFKTNSGVHVCFVCLASETDHDAALQEYETIWMSLTLQKA